MLDFQLSLFIRSPYPPLTSLHIQQADLSSLVSAVSPSILTGGVDEKSFSLPKTIKVTLPSLMSDPNPQKPLRWAENQEVDSLSVHTLRDPYPQPPLSFFSVTFSHEMNVHVLLSPFHHMQGRFLEDRQGLYESLTVEFTPFSLYLALRLKKKKHLIPHSLNSITAVH